MEIAMKKLVIAGVALATVIGTPALAADMALKAPPPPAPVSSWTGFYLGVDVGGTWFNQSATWNPLPSPAAFGVFPITGTEKASDFIGGVYAGYNYQIGTNWLVGVEADWSGTNANATINQPWLFNPGGGVVPGSFTTMSTKLDWLSSVRGRVGVIAAQNFLAYVTGGVGWGEFNYSASNSNGSVLFPYNAPVSFNKTQTGFVVGGGLEYMPANHWLLRAEYLYYGFNNGPNVIGIPTLPANAGFPSNYVWGRDNVSVGRVGVAYKF
jgi:outer membrane immunogenic protein